MILNPDSKLLEKKVDTSEKQAGESLNKIRQKNKKVMEFSKVVNTKHMGTSNWLNLYMMNCWTTIPFVPTHKMTKTSIFQNI